jgi:hypothetical protein
MDTTHSDKTGNYVGVELNPGEGGSIGQAIAFGRDFDTKVVLWKGDGPAGWATWLASFAEVLESGEGFELGASTESEGSEDDVGYEGYFFDGTGRGAGEGTSGMSSGGMRLTGEYRGWTTLEAWADKSVRKWQQVGLVPGKRPRVADLLDDPAPSLVVSPMEPSSSARPSPRAASPPLLLPSTPIKADGPNHEDEELDATVRLVDNRSEVGLAPESDQVQSDETDDTSSQAETAYDTASSLNGSSLPPSRASHSAQDLREGQPGI